MDDIEYILIPFYLNGDLFEMRVPESHVGKSMRNVTWMDNFWFNDTIEIGNVPSMRVKVGYLPVKSIFTGRRYVISIRDAIELLKSSFSREGKISGLWTFEKKYERYTIKLIEPTMELDSSATPGEPVELTSNLLSRSGSFLRGTQPVDPAGNVATDEKRDLERFKVNKKPGSSLIEITSKKNHEKIEENESSMKKMIGTTRHDKLVLLMIKHEKIKEKFINTIDKLIKIIEERKK